MTTLWVYWPEITRDMYICLALFRELEKKTFHGRTQSEHEIKCLYFIISHIWRFPWEKYLKCRRFLRYAELMSGNVVMTGKTGQKVHLLASRTRFSQDIEFTRDTPIFCSSKEELSFMRGRREGIADDESSLEGFHPTKPNSRGRATNYS